MSLFLEQDHVVMHGVSWQTFQQLLADRGERCGILLTYDRGTVELRMPSQEHEWIKTTISQVVEAIAFARDLHYRSLGSTTFAREDLARGFEPDACFYLDHADAIAPDRPLDLSFDPPPDLVLAVNIRPNRNRRSPAKLAGQLRCAALPIYAALGVPEVWRYTDGKVEIQCLTADTYRVSDTSRVLPGITAELVTRGIETARTATNQTTWFKNMAAEVVALTR